VLCAAATVLVVCFTFAKLPQTKTPSTHCLQDSTQNERAKQERQAQQRAAAREKRRAEAAAASAKLDAMGGTRCRNMESV
jgi:hypothetical protein